MLLKALSTPGPVKQHIKFTVNKYLEDMQTGQNLSDLHLAINTVSLKPHFRIVSVAASIRLV